MVNEEAPITPKLADGTLTAPNPRQGTSSEEQLKERQLIVNWLVDEAAHMIPEGNRNLTTLLAFFIHNNAHRISPRI